MRRYVQEYERERQSQTRAASPSSYTDPSHTHHLRAGVFSEGELQRGLAPRSCDAGGGAIGVPGTGAGASSGYGPMEWAATVRGATGGMEEWRPQYMADSRSRQHVSELLNSSLTRMARGDPQLRPTRSAAPSADVSMVSAHDDSSIAILLEAAEETAQEWERDIDHAVSEWETTLSIKDVDRSTSSDEYGLPEVPLSPIRGASGRRGSRSPSPPPSPRERDFSLPASPQHQTVALEAEVEAVSTGSARDLEVQRDRKTRRGTGRRAKPQPSSVQAKQQRKSERGHQKGSEGKVQKGSPLCKQDSNGTWRWSKAPSTVDLTHDRVRSRCLGALTILWSIFTLSLLLLHLLVSPILAAIPLPGDVHSLWVRQPTGACLQLGSGVGGMWDGVAPTIGARDVWGLPVMGARLEVRVELLRALPQGAPNRLDCSAHQVAQPLHALSTVEAMRLNDACQPRLRDSIVTTTIAGSVSLRSLSAAQGPPGLWRLHISIPGAPAPHHLDVRVAPRVAQLEVLTHWDWRRPVGVGAPLPRQPTLRLIGADGGPVVGATCVAFSSPHSDPLLEGTPSNVRSPMTQLQQKSAGRFPATAADGGIPATPLSTDEMGGDSWERSLGQQVALLEGAVSRPSNASGHADWRNLSVTSASTASWTFIHFACEGLLGSWHRNRPNSRDAGLPLPPVAAQPLWLRPRVATVLLETPSGESWSQGDVAINVTEGTAIPRVLLPRVRLLDEMNRPLSGLRVVALVVGNGRHAVFPLRHPPPSDTAGAKTLQGALSDATDDSGVATFPALKFSAPSSARYATASTDLLGGLMQTLSFCADGICTASIGPTAPTFRVFTSVSQVELERAPVVLRISEPPLVDDAAASAESTSEGEWAVLRVTDDRGNGVSGKRLDGRDGIVALVEEFDGSRVLSGLQLADGQRTPGESDAGGILRVWVRVTWASRDAQSTLRARPVRLRFSVDGVRSEVTSTVRFVPPRTSPGSSEKCVALRTLRPPPGGASVGVPFREPTVLQAVGVNGEAMEGLFVAAVSVEERRSRPLFQMGTAAGPDVQVSGSEGRVDMSWTRPLQNYARQTLHGAGRRGDVIHSGPSGTMLLQYIAFRPNNASATGVNVGGNVVPANNPEFQKQVNENLALYGKGWLESGCAGDIVRTNGHEERRRQCAVECSSEVFAVQVSGADQSGVSFGNGGMSSTDVWIETPVAAQLPLPPLWSDVSSPDERSSETNGWSISTTADALPGPLYHADPGVSIPGFGSSPAIASQLRRPDTTSALVGGSGGDTEDLDGLKEWVGGQEAVPLPLAPLPSTTAPATTTTTQPATVVQEQHEDEPTAAELMDGSFQRVANLSASLREGLDGMASSVAEGLDALPAARRDQSAAAAVVAAAAERASDGLIDVRLLSRQEETVPGFQAALAMLADFASDQAELDTQVRQTLTAVEGRLGGIAAAALTSRDPPPALANLAGLTRAASRVVEEQQAPRVVDVQGVLQTMRALQDSALQDTQTVLDALATVTASLEEAERGGGTGALLEAATSAVTEYSEEIVALGRRIESLSKTVLRRRTALSELTTVLTELSAGLEGRRTGRRLAQAPDSGVNNGVASLVASVVWDRKRRGGSSDEGREVELQAALHSRLSQRFLTLHARVPTLSSTSRWVEPELLGVPPLVSVLAARYNGGSGTRSVADAVRCPSPEVPQCWLHPKEGILLEGAPPEGCATCYALSSEVWLFHRTELLTVMQPVSGAGAFSADPTCLCTSDGQAAVGVLLGAGHPGEYTLSLRATASSALPSPPVTVYLQNQVAALHLLPPSSPGSGGSRDAGAAPLVPSDVQLALRFVGPDGLPCAGFRAVAVPVTAEGSPIGPDAVALDARGALGAAVPPHQAVLPSAMSTESDHDGLATFTPVLVAGRPGACFHLRFLLLPCGPRDHGADCPAARAEGINVAAAAVESDVSSERFCVASDEGVARMGDGGASLLFQPRSDVSLGERWSSPSDANTPLAVRLPTTGRGIGRDDTLHAVALLPRVDLPRGDGEWSITAERFDFAGRVLGGQLCWLLGARPISAACAALGDNQERSLVVEMASLAWLHAGGLEQLTLDAVASPWIEVPRGGATRGWQPGAVTATRAVQLGGGVALEMVAPLPERVRVGETLLLHVRAVGPSGRPAVGWPVELELRTEEELGADAASGGASAGTVRLAGASARTDGRGLATVASSVVAAPSAAFHALIRPAGGGSALNLGVIQVVNTVQEAAAVQWGDLPRGAALTLYNRAGGAVSSLALRAPSQSGERELVLPELQVRLFFADGRPVTVRSLRLQLVTVGAESLKQKEPEGEEGGDPRLELTVLGWKETEGQALAVSASVSYTLPAGEYAVKVWINGGDSRTFTHPPLLLKLRPGDVAPYAASLSQPAALGIASLVAALIAALSAFSFLGNSLARHPLWATSGLLAAFSAVGLGWLIRHLIPNVLSVPLMLVPGLAAPLHAAILLEWVYNAVFRRQRPRAVYWDFEAARSRALLAYIKHRIYENQPAQPSSTAATSPLPWWLWGLVRALPLYCYRRCPADGDDRNSDSPPPLAFFFPQRLLAAAMGGLGLVATLVAATWTAAGQTETVVGWLLMRSDPVLRVIRIYISPTFSDDAAVLGNLALKFGTCLRAWSVASLAIVAAQWAATLLNFRAATFAARRGEGPFASGSNPNTTLIKARSRAALFVGPAMGATAVGWAVVTMVGAILTMPLVWPPWRDSLRAVFSACLPATAAALAAWLASLATAAGVRQVMASRERAGRQAEGGMLTLEITGLALGAFHGAISAALRALLLSVCALLGLSRVGAPLIHGAPHTTGRPFAWSWVDPTGDSFVALGALHHSVHCPALAVAAWSLARGGWSWKLRAGRRARGGGGGRMLGHSAQRVRCRLRLALLLARSPQLTQWRAHHLALVDGRQQQTEKAV